MHLKSTIVELNGDGTCPFLEVSAISFSLISALIESSLTSTDLNHPLTSKHTVFNPVFLFVSPMANNLIYTGLPSNNVTSNNSLYSMGLNTYSVGNEVILPYFYLNLQKSSNTSG